MANPAPPCSRTPATGWRAKAPNAITIARLILTLAFIITLAIQDPHKLDQTGNGPARPWAIAAIAIFIIAAITDAADGYLARKWNAISRFGRIMDPLADKLLILGAFVMLAGRDLGQISAVAPWMAVLILFRELLVTTARSVFESAGIDFSAATSGKIKMVIQSIAVPLILLDIAISQHPGPIARSAAWAATIATALSIIPYAHRIATAASPARAPSAANHHSSTTDPTK